VDKGSDEQLNKAPAMNGNESTGKRMDVPLAIGFIVPKIATTSTFIVARTLKT
jgi:hypothetical protein